jgi:DNA-binding NtrC family response regulator
MNENLFNKIININSPVLITGPTGTGKSQLAHKIFKYSSINKEKFLVLHLANIKEDLFESELYGHKKGSFTGASENKLGYFYEVGKGTLFLDEIGELSLEAQKKLLYLLEEKKFTPVGSTFPIEFKGRIIMATNKDLLAMVKTGSFREDLYFRINIFNLELESISNDKIKLKQILNDQLIFFKSKYHKNELTLDLELEKLLIDASWAGNYRELKNTLEYLVVMSDGVLVKISDLPKNFEPNLQALINKEEIDLQTNGLDLIKEDFNEALEAFEARYLRVMLERFSGRVNETARILGMSKTTLINKSKKYKINTLKMRADASTPKDADLAA